MPDLRAELATDNLLKAELLSRWPELAEDEELLCDTLDGISNLDVAVLTVMRTAIEREAYAEAINGMIRTLRERQARLSGGAQKMRGAILAVMQAAGRKRIAAPDMTINVLPGQPGVVVTDIDAVPEEFVKVEKSPRMREINAIIKSGGEVPGTAPRNPTPYLAVHRS